MNDSRRTISSTIRLVGIGSLALAGCGSSDHSGAGPSGPGGGGSTTVMSGSGGKTASGGGGSTESGGATSSGGSNSGGTAGSGGTGGSGGTSGAGGTPVAEAGSNSTGSGGRAGGSATGGSGGGGRDAGGTGGGIAAGDGGPGAGGGMSPSVGCGKATTLMSGAASIDVNGTMRQYTLAIPDNYDPGTPYKLIFGFHPLGGSMQFVVNNGYYGLQRMAGGSAIFVAPDGLPAQGTNKGWPNTNDQDIAFTKAMVALFESNLCVDQSRIFSTGFSYGGIMSLTIGCEMSDVFRAIAPMSGFFFSGGCNTPGAHPIAVWQSQGDADTTVMPANAMTANNVFVARNHCTMQTMPVTPSPCIAYQGCDVGEPVEWCVFSGGHQIPNFSSNAIWTFFNQF